MSETLRLRLLVKTLSPLAFSTRLGTISSFMDTFDYVPGTSLRGAVASHFLRKIANADDERFRNIFLQGEVLFSNLYPIHEPDISPNSTSESPAASSSILPATAYACKSHKEKHGVKDIFFRSAAIKLLNHESADSLLDDILHCSHCKETAQRIKGFYQKTFFPDVKYNIIEVHKRHLTHVGINRASQSAENGFLFSQQVISEAREFGDNHDFVPQLFCGELIVNKAHSDFVVTKLLPQGTELRLGESRTRGLGRIHIRDCRIVAADCESDIRTRILDFNRQFAKHLAFQNHFISLTLQSDAILMDEFMRPRTMLDIRDFRRALGDHDYAAMASQNILQLVFCNTGKRLVQTWNAASGYPKPENVAITMGSVFLFKVAAESPENLVAPLTALQEYGIGMRRREGFGRVTICDPFHWEVDDLWRAI
jgi:CRISPR-associated protein Csx10